MVDPGGVTFHSPVAQRFEDLSRSPAESFQVVIDWLITESAARRTNRVMRDADVKTRDADFLGLKK